MKVVPFYHKCLATTVLLLSLVWNEWLSYKIYSHTWKEHVRVRSMCSNLLIVADPQLIGYRNEPYWVGPISRWDSDRYLSKGFSFANAHVDPDAIIFLGDLFDEGFDSEDDEFDDTLDRFKNVFQFDSQVSVFIYGDNDIGGESELINEYARERFKNTFGSTFMETKPYSIYQAYLFESKDLQLMYSAGEKEKLKIMLTHVPYLTYYNSFIDTGQGVDLILSGHDHFAMIYEMDRKPSGKLFSTRPNRTSPVFREVLGRSRRVVELQTPTCSYRMGVPEMGYGHVTICEDTSGNATVQFSVLWLPSRYTNLSYYVGALIIATAIVLHGRSQRRRRYTNCM